MKKVSNLCKYCGGTQHTLYEGESDPYTIDEHHWKCGVCGEINTKGDYMEANKEKNHDITVILECDVCHNKLKVGFTDLKSVENQAKIADLEAKLAEKEEQILNDCDKCIAEHHELTEKVLELSKQLAESEKENEKLKQIANGVNLLKLSGENIEDYALVNIKFIPDLEFRYEDLKQQLTESKQEANDWKQRFESSEERFKTFNSNGVTALNLKNEKIEELKQQLAKKEEQLETARNLLERNAIIHLRQLKEKDQDKISFCIEQLEKVKEKINNCPITDYDTNKHFVKMYQSDAIRQLDNQIKQLKEGK